MSGSNGGVRSRHSELLHKELQATGCTSNSSHFDLLLCGKQFVPCATWNQVTVSNFFDWLILFYDKWAAQEVFAAPRTLGPVALSCVQTEQIALLAKVCVIGPKLPYLKISDCILAVNWLATDALTVSLGLCLCVCVSEIRTNQDLCFLLFGLYCPFSNPNGFLKKSYNDKTIFGTRKWRCATWQKSLNVLRINNSLNINL